MTYERDLLTVAVSLCDNMQKVLDGMSNVCILVAVMTIKYYATESTITILNPSFVSEFITWDGGMKSSAVCYVRGSDASDGSEVQLEVGNRAQYMQALREGEYYAPVML